MVDPTIALIFLTGLIPGMLSSYLVMTGLRKYSRHRYQAAMERTVRRSPYAHHYLQSQNYQYVEGLGYIVGDITCQFNARSAYLRCAINPSGPCEKCPHYESIWFVEMDPNRQPKLNP